MGRLQRKKPTGAKKKKKQNKTGGETAAATAPATSKSSGILSSASKNPGSRSLQRSLSAGRASEPGRIRGFIDKTVQFLREVRIELKKVAWPSRKQTLGSTAVVLVLVLLISAFLGLVDVGLTSIMRVVLQ